MQLDFWNNPIIVSAFRVKYRRGGFSTGPAIFLLILTAGGLCLQYYQDKLRVPWHQIYYPLLMGVQFFICGVIACTSTSSSLRSEVANRTLDFQRIAALSPLQILLGKLLGEPAIAYFLALSTIPLAFWCFLSGGVAFELMVVMYVNLATTTLLCGAAGLICRLDRPAANIGGVYMSLLALLTPIPLFAALAQKRPWDVALPLFGGKFSVLFVTPPAQFLLAVLCFQIMVRQLKNPQNTLLSKGVAYLILTVIDLVTSALIFDSGPFAITLRQRAAIFCLVHLLVSLALIMGMTPWRETIYSWVWRFRGRVPRLPDLWLGDRSENGLALLTFCAIGIINLGVFVLLPGVQADGVAELTNSMPIFVPAVAIMVVWTLAFGTLHQWLILIGGRQVIPFLFILVIFLSGGPALLGQYDRLGWLVPLSPGIHFVYWFGGRGPGVPPAFNAAPLIGIYGALLILAWLALRRRMALVDRWITHKLRQMGALPAAVQAKSLVVEPASLSSQEQ
jgi:hypothetical protein